MSATRDPKDVSVRPVWLHTESEMAVVETPTYPTVKVLSSRERSVPAVPHDMVAGHTPSMLSGVKVLECRPVVASTSMVAPPGSVKGVPSGSKTASVHVPAFDV